jgi:hypothetical protein
VAGQAAEARTLIRRHAAEIAEHRNVDATAGMPEAMSA